MRFKKYVKESSDMKTEIVMNLVKKHFSGIELKKENRRQTSYFVRSENRVLSKNKLLKDLKSKNITFQEKRISGNTKRIIDIPTGPSTYIRLAFKPLVGTTGKHKSFQNMNSTIVELFPCIMFMKKLTWKDNKDLYNKINKMDLKKCGVIMDSKSASIGKQDMQNFIHSNKFEEKIDNAKAIFDYLKQFDAANKIKSIEWLGSKRTLPEDIIINTSKGVIGISLKAGTKKSKETELNTYVVPALKLMFGSNHKSKVNKLVEMLYNDIYSKIGLPFNMVKSGARKEAVEKIFQFEKQNPSEYESLYVKQREIIRGYLAKLIKENPDKFIKFINERVLKRSEIPVITIKAIGSSWKEVKNDSVLRNIVPFIENINTRLNPTQGQELYVDLITKDGIKKTMWFTIRTSKAGAEHKLGQFENLRVNYNGLM